jgi:hypothetical protein
MKNSSLTWAALSSGLILGVGSLLAQDAKQASSYFPVDIHETFSAIFSRMTAAKPDVIKRHSELLEQRYDLLVFRLPSDTRANKSVERGDHSVESQLQGCGTWQIVQI